MGILDILDETTRFQQGSDLSFVQQLNGKYESSSLYTKAKGDRPEFGIKHFAAQVSWSNLHQGLVVQSIVSLKTNILVN